MPAIKFEHIDKIFLPDGSLYKTDVFRLNDKELVLCDKNLSIFERIMKSIEEIKNSRKPFVLNNDYMESSDSFVEFQNSFGFSNAESFGELSRFIHSSESIRRGIQSIEETVQKAMEDYFT